MILTKRPLYQAPVALAQRYDLTVAILRVAIESMRFIECEKIRAVSIDVYEAILAARMQSLRDASKMSSNYRCSWPVNSILDG